jgi:predicted ATP-grasp superfamily ATP-dependent carboligase
VRIFVYEHLTCGGAAGGDLPRSLEREGRAMLRAISEDLSRLPGVTVEGGPESRERFDELARACDGTLLIAPEIGGELARLARRVLEVGGRLLGPTPGAIEAASDKLELPRRLASLGIAHVPSEAAGIAPSFGFPIVVKPRRGAGSLDVKLILGPDDLAPTSDDAIQTPLCEGIAASVLVLAGPRGILPLRAGEQLLSDDGRFTYLGGRIPLPTRLETRARRLAVRAVNSVTGLAGFVGVDLLIDPVGREAPQDRVVEINPRLTTSYVGLRALAETNLAEHWLRAIHGEIPAEPRWRGGGVRFRPDGTVELEEARS